jgi:hypothetical protein
MITLPFRLVGGLLATAVRLGVAIVALALMAAGILVSMTIIGAIVGVPLFLLGLFLLWRAVLG